MAKNDISLIVVQMESDKYIRTLKDKRLSFTDQMSSFGNNFNHIYSAVLK